MQGQAALLQVRAHPSHAVRTHRSLRLPTIRPRTWAAEESRLSVFGHRLPESPMTVDDGEPRPAVYGRRLAFTASPTVLDIIESHSATPICPSQSLINLAGKKPSAFSIGCGPGKLGNNLGTTSRENRAEPEIHRYRINEDESITYIIHIYFDTVEVIGSIPVTLATLSIAYKHRLTSPGKHFKCQEVSIDLRSPLACFVFASSWRLF